MLTAHSGVLRLDMLHFSQVHGLSGQQAVHAAGLHAKAGRGGASAARACRRESLSQWGRANNMLMVSPQASVVECLTCPPAGGVAGPSKGEARGAVAVGPGQCPLECGAPVGRRSCPRAPPGLQRQPGKAALWDGRGAAAHRGVVEGRWVLLLWSCCQVCTGSCLWL